VFSATTKRQNKAQLAGKTQSARYSQSIRYAHGLGPVHGTGPGCSIDKSRTKSRRFRRRRAGALW